MDGVLQLRADILHVLLRHLVLVVEGQIEEDHGDVQLLGDVLIPLDHRVADIVAAEDHVGHGDIAGDGLLDVHIAQIHPGVRAQIGGITLPLGAGDKLGCALAGTDGGGVVLRIDHGDVHGLQQLLGRDRGGPRHQTPLLLRPHGVGVVTIHQLSKHFL